MTMKLKAIKGMNDILPENTSSLRQIESLIHNFFTIHGYEEIRTPIVEKTELFKRVVGDQTDIVNKEMYSWIDNDKESLTLRPELTAPTIRSYLENNLDKLNKVTKLYYIGPAFRRERPQKGRQRQFHQFGVEAIGSLYPEQDAEVISMAYNIYEMLGIENLELMINSVGSNISKNNYAKELKKYLSDYFNDLSDISKERYTSNPLRILDTKNKKEQDIINNAPSILEFLSPEDLNHFNDTKRYLDKLNINYKVNDKLVRGLDYYTMTTFEIRTDKIGSQDALCGGGRYNNLVKELGGGSYPAIGFGAGIERLMIALGESNEDKKSKIDVFVVSIDDLAIINALKICDKLRSQLGINVRMDLSRSSFKSQMRQANKLNADYVVILSKEEVKKRVGIIKIMSTGDQFEVPLDTIHRHFDIETSKNDN
ncbi:MAG: histidine--tRNA ligase [Pelagibacteraceae bacterium TMED237]|nr:histidine--tRNA ligase [Candidatus Neomarinimicrobiota bacterium]OUW95042.1 MAG: histidine--tRNA ligase [Pelagibacteraceae bacterium TMED237]